MKIESSMMLLKAREYEEISAKREVRKRPNFHLTPLVGWMNDPNGFSLYKGEYHLFYQSYPYDTVWGPMHWAHIKTKDFISWTQLPAAIAPDEIYDGQGCFSGSAVEHQGKHILMYTGVEEGIESDGSKYVRQRQCIAIGDGIDYKKEESNPVISTENIPKGSSLIDFRDPKIWKDGDAFYAVVGSRGSDGSGQIPLFSSENLKDWKLLSILASCNNQYGSMWECPDFFALSNKYVMLISPQDMLAEGLDFHNGNGTMYLVGDFNKEDYSFTRESECAIDYGLDFYAPQTVEATDGRRIMIAWMQSWDNHIIGPNQAWSGMMTIPRELTIIDGKLYQNPVRELEGYRSNKVVHENVEICGNPVQLAGVQGRSTELLIELDLMEATSFTLDFAVGKEIHGNLYTRIYVDFIKEILTFDRTYCGIRKDVISTRSMKCLIKEGRLKIHLLIDTYSAEIFVNDGEAVMTCLYDTSIEANEICFKTDGRVNMNITKYNIGNE